MTNINHQLTVAFTVVGPEGVAPENLPPALLRAALMKHIHELDRHGEWGESVQDCRDSFETNAEVSGPVFCPKCGGEEFREVESCDVYHEVSFTEDGALYIHCMDGDVDWDGNGDSQLACIGCGHRFPIPEDVEVTSD
jgi:hypothetical protein